MSFLPPQNIHFHVLFHLVCFTNILNKYLATDIYHISVAVCFDGKELRSIDGNEKGKKECLEGNNGATDLMEKREWLKAQAQCTLKAT